MTAFGPDLPRFAELAPGVRRLLAPNPSMMTGPGTNTYLFGATGIAVVDPGPNLDEHLDRIVALSGAAIRWILVTHTHPDHSPAAMPLARLTGAQLLGMPPPDGRHQDSSFVPDRVLADGDTLVTDEFELEAVHTPGHASNHLCYRHAETNWLLSGDQEEAVVDMTTGGSGSGFLDAVRFLLARLRRVLGGLDGTRGVAAISACHAAPGRTEASTRTRPSAGRRSMTP